MEGLILTPTQVLDNRVGELFRPRWPTGYGLFAQVGLECLCTLQGFATIVQRTTATGRAKDELDAVGQLLSARPIAARLPVRELLEVLLEVQHHAAPWEVAQCTALGLRLPCVAGYRVQPVQYQPLAGLPTTSIRQARANRGRCLPWCSLQAVTSWHPATWSI